MVEQALDRLSERGLVEPRRSNAATARNLIVALCAEQQTSPIVSTGTLDSWAVIVSRCCCEQM